MNVTVQGSTATITGSQAEIEQNTEALRSLPGSRWRGRREVRFLATPLAIFTVRGMGAKLDEASEAIASEYDRQLMPGVSTRDYTAEVSTELWNHQKAGVEWLSGRYAGMLAFGMGSGKTLTAIAATRSWDARSILIMCPKSVVGVWRREFDRHCTMPIRAAILEHGSSETKAAHLWRERGRWDLYAGDDTLFVAVVNYESAWRGRLAQVILSHAWDTVILDESHRIKSPTGKASKFAAALGTKAKRRLCLTGTPMPHSPLDLYAQFRFLDAAIEGTSFVRFREKYSVSDPKFPSRVMSWKNQSQLNSKLGHWSMVCRTEDVVDLPPVTHQEITVELSPKTRRIYSDMAKHAVAEISKGQEVSATNILVQLLRLQEITGGQLDGKVIGHEKRDALIDICQDIPENKPVVVFCRFRHDLEMVREAAAKLGRTYGEISGVQKDLTEHATMPEGITMMGVQQQSGGVGIDLTRASVGIWYSLGYSLGDYEQANARISRPGQKEHVTMLHLVAERTVDARIYDAIRKRKDLVESVLTGLTQAVQGI